MKFEEERIARNLYAKLLAYFNSSNISPTISIEGAGVHWHCNATLNTQECNIHCFAWASTEDRTPQYYITFESPTAINVCGRTSNVQEALTSCKAWMQGNSIESMYSQFSFIDTEKQAYKKVSLGIIKHQPILETLDIKLENPYNETVNYSISHENRSCNLVYSDGICTRFAFAWDECHVFYVQQDNLSTTALIIKKWLVDKIMPSQLNKEFECIQLNNLALYYERGEGIMGEFIESWDDVSEFYSKLRFAFSNVDILKLLTELRNRGFDKTLRAGTSLHFLILSRSRKHGLGSGQKFIRFCFLNNKIKIDNEKQQIWEFDSISYNDKIGLLLKELETALIN